MIVYCMVSLAFAGKWDGMESDVVATAHIDAPVEVVRDQFLDLHTLELYSDECVSELTIGAPSRGYGAPFRMRFHAGPWSRRVEGRIDEIGRRYVDVEHSGSYGFTTRYQVEPDEDGAGTQVTMTTFLDPPPWPFKPIFFRKVRPGWAACHHQLLSAVSEALAGQTQTVSADELEMTVPQVETDGAIEPVVIPDGGSLPEPE